MKISKFTRSIHLLLLAVAAMASLGASFALQAQTRIPDFLNAKGSPPEPQAKSWVLIESKTGWVLAERKMHERVEPASLTKLMTAYLTFEALASGKLDASDKVYISKKAWKAPGSRMFLNVDTSATVAELINGLIIQSGNDAAVALAEQIGGSESGFARMMNEAAAKLGMTDTNYVNASGLPDPEHYTSAYDTAVISRAIIQTFPDMYTLFSILEYTYNGITQPNRNSLLRRDDRYDGLKTGHTQSAGYCLVGSAISGNTRFIAVVMGAESNESRVQGVGSLVEYGFAQYETTTVLDPATPAKVLPLFKGEVTEAGVGSISGISVVLPRGQAQALAVSFELPDKLIAPLDKSQPVGRAQISFNGNEIGYVELLPVENYESGPIWTQLIDAVKIKLF